MSIAAAPKINSIDFSSAPIRLSDCSFVSKLIELDDNTAVTFVTAPNITNRAVVVVEKENVPNGMSLDVFTQGNLNDLQHNTPSFHLISSNSTTLSGNPAHQIVFTALSATNHEMRKGMSIWTIKDGIAYIITYRTEPGVASFTTQLPLVSHMIKSFQIIK